MPTIPDDAKRYQLNGEKNTQKHVFYSLIWNYTDLFCDNRGIHNSISLKSNNKKKNTRLHPCWKTYLARQKYNKQVRKHQGWQPYSLATFICHIETSPKI